ncbi:MAG: hypothetical protein M1820_008782 [Bogoriella megaspora]|nr:MAG: hypothetical protein M1820_008782 [Bogoriella megaspora]
MGSLFDRIGPKDQTSNSATATSQPPATGLFANLGKAQAPTNFASGLSGGIGSTASQPQQSGGLFGSTNNNQQNQPQTSAAGSGLSGGGLFANLGKSQAPPTRFSAGLVGGSGSTSQPATQASNAGGLFGNTNASQAPQPQSGPTGGTLGGSFLGGASQAQPWQAQTGTQQSQNAASPAQPAYFDHLLERGKKRTPAGDGESPLGGLPSLELGLDDIARKIRNIGQGSPSAQARAGSSSASVILGSNYREPDTYSSSRHYLLAGSGVPAASALRDLNTFSAQTGVPTVESIHDTNIEGYVNDLQARSTLDLIAEGLEDAKRDFDNFLEENVQMEWDAQRRRIYEHFGLAKPDESGDDAVAGASRASFRETGSFARSARKSKGFGATAQMSFGRSSMAKSILGPAPINGDNRGSVFNDAADKGAAGGTGYEARYDRERQEKYAQKVRELNSARLEEILYPVAKHFQEVEAQIGSEYSGQFVAAYQAIAQIVEENANVLRPTDPGAIKQRDYAKQYLDDSPMSRDSIFIRRRILKGSQTYLETKAFNQLESDIAKFPKEANLGGVPSTLNKVRAFVRLKATHKELGADPQDLQMIGDDYVWAIIYNLIRCGLIQDAAQYVIDNERAIKAMDRSFPLFMTSFAGSSDRRLSPELHSRINGEFQQRARAAPDGSLDPYRTACVKIIGRCDLSKRNLEGINQDADTWLWLQFVLAREVSRVEENAGEVYGLSDLQAIIKDLGQRHFLQTENAEQTVMYFYMQILAGLFEQAVDTLYRINHIAAVHFAIVLDFYGLLRVASPDATSELLSFTTRQQPQLSFGRMLGYYTSDFRGGKAVTAADYLVLICLNSDLPGDIGKAQVQQTCEALRELVLETRDYAELLGDIRPDGQRIKGALEQRLQLIGYENYEAFLKDVTVQAASIANDSGRTTDAVLLFHLGEDYDQVITLVNRALSEAISIELTAEPLRLEPLRPRNQNPPSAPGATAQQLTNPNTQSDSLSLSSIDNPAELAQKMLTTYNRNALILKQIRDGNRDACGMLLQMWSAKLDLRDGRWAAAVDKIKALNIIPINAGHTANAVRSNRIAAQREAAATFGAMEPVIAKHVGDLLKWTILAVGKQREVVLSSGYETGEKQAVVQELFGIAQDCMVFGGLLRYAMPGRVFEDLAVVGQDVPDLDVQMGF